MHTLLRSLKGSKVKEFRPVHHPRSRGTDCFQRLAIPRGFNDVSRRVRRFYRREFMDYGASSTIKSARGDQQTRA